ncbi:hypothetical protein [Mycobacterium sp. ITM-2016-00318]|uniref:DUF7159 family protein n=1 Tax=Mycobacterium sp. ITM-2016-00318 TaxID=2099693 RepID=UPI000CF991A5|nr:hypothetical protein [Mycobacterium sp. ITM-2016-00318]WNG90816.1 hypothetical protein C6A82_014810 [Mycobacterium sp. ITM-2016-00318]
MDAVLGLSMTPTTVGLVLVEGQEADGATMDKDEFAVHDRGLASAVNTSEKAAAAVMRTEAIAAARGHRLHSIGVTWSADADTEASLLLESLSESGFDNVVAVRLPEATEALARGIADVIGYESTAVCVIEPDAVVVLIVDTADGAVQTAVNHAVTTDEDLARWLSSIFAQADWRPEALVLVGSGSDLEAITPHLEDVLAVPVFVPAEAQLALARGAAIASTLGSDAFIDESGHDSGRVKTVPQRSSLFPRIGAAGAMLGVGVVTFVVSGSLAIGMQLTGNESANPAETPAAASDSEKPAAVKAAQPAPAAPAPTVEAALPAPPPPAELPPPVYDTEPVPISEPLPQDAPALIPVDGTVPQGAVAANGVPLPPGVTDPAPGLVPAEVTPVPERSGGFLGRIRDRISGIGRPDEPAQAPVDVAPPAQDPLLVPPPADAPPPPPPG